MPTTLPRKKSGEIDRQSRGTSSLCGPTEATIYIALVLGLATAILPGSFVLPAAALVIVTSGLALGAWILWSKKHRSRGDDGSLDIAGFLVLFGFAAAIVCDKSEALSLLAGLPGA